MKITIKQSAINWILFILVLFSIGFSVLRIMPFEISEDTYIGTTTTLLSLAATLIIGYQIYNAVELKNEIKEQRKLYEEAKKESQEINVKLKMQQYQTQEGFDIISSLISYNKSSLAEDSMNAFGQMHHALLSSIETDRDDYEWIFMYMRKFLENFNGQAFYGAWEQKGDEWVALNSLDWKKCKTLNAFIDDYLKPIKEDENLLRKNKNFVKIRMEYNRIMQILDKVMDKIKENPTNALPYEFIHDEILKN